MGQEREHHCGYSPKAHVGKVARYQQLTIPLVLRYHRHNLVIGDECDKHSTYPSMDAMGCYRNHLEFYTWSYSNSLDYTGGMGLCMDGLLDIDRY